MLYGRRRCPFRPNICHCAQTDISWRLSHVQNWFKATWRISVDLIISRTKRKPKAKILISMQILFRVLQTRARNHMYHCIDAIRRSLMEVEQSRSAVPFCRMQTYKFFNTYLLQRLKLLEFIQIQPLGDVTCQNPVVFCCYNCVGVVCFTAYCLQVSSECPHLKLRAQLIKRPSPEPRFLLRQNRHLITFTSHHLIHARILPHCVWLTETWSAHPLRKYPRPSIEHPPQQCPPANSKSSVFWDVALCSPVQSTHLILLGFIVILSKFEWT
jgi:hypothetical protein